MKQENDLEIEEEPGATSDGEESIDPELNEDDDNNDVDNTNEISSDDDEIEMPSMLASSRMDIIRGSTSQLESQIQSPTEGI